MIDGGQHIGYNKDNELTATKGVPTKESSSDMSYNPQIAALHEVVDRPAHSPDPIMERTCDGYGQVKIYPPSTATDLWSLLSWRLTTEQSPEGKPIDVTLNSQSVYECFERPYFIESKHMFTPLD